MSTTRPGTTAPTVVAPVVRGPADAGADVEALVHDLIRLMRTSGR